MSAAPITGPLQRLTMSASILPPAPADMLGVRTDKIGPHLISATGVHGGAGTSVIAAMLDHVGDSGQRWPGRTDEPPFVVLIARESARGLAAAEMAVRQFRTGHAPEHLVLLGVALVATHRGNKHTPALRQRRDLLTGSGLFEHVWNIGWHQGLIDQPVEELPHIGPDAPAVKKPHPITDVPADIAAMGRDLRDHAVAVLQQRRGQQ